MLLAALARAGGIPARTAIGLVYVEPRAFSATTCGRVYIDGRWIGIDSTLAQGGASGAYLELAHSSLRRALQQLPPRAAGLRSTVDRSA